MVCGCVDTSTLTAFGLRHSISSSRLANRPPFGVTIRENRNGVLLFISGAKDFSASSSTATLSSESLSIEATS